MTLILTLLAREHIVQVADRRLTWPDGRLADDDTNKAVFYCGRVAVAYTGVSQIEGKCTAEWIGSCMKDHTQVEEAMNHVADRAERYFRQIDWPDKKLAVVATGWGMHRGELPIRRFICVASNFMTDSWEWQIYGPMQVRTRLLDDTASHIFVVGQRLYPGEMVRLTRLMKRTAERGNTVISWVRLLQNMVQSSASRNERVGKGMITHLLSRKAVVEGRSLIVTPLTLDCNSFLYTSKEGRTDQFQGAVIACKGTLLTNFGGGSIPPGGKGAIRTEMEESARRHPLGVSSSEVKYSSACPFCAADARKRGSDDPPNIVEGELPLTETEAWVYCRGTTGHLLFIRRASN